MSSQNELPEHDQAWYIDVENGKQGLLNRTEFETAWGLNWAPLIDGFSSDLIWMTTASKVFWKLDVWFIPQVDDGPSRTLDCILGHKDYPDIPLLTTRVTPARLGETPLIQESFGGSIRAGLKPDDMVVRKVRIISQSIAWAWLELEANLEAARLEGARTGLRVAREHLEKQRKQAMASDAPQDTADDIDSSMGQAADTAARKSKGCFGVLFLGFVMIAGVTAGMTLY